MNIAYGKLYIDRTIGDEWGYLLVNGDIREKCFKEMGLEDMGYEIPEYEAHISVFTDEQVKQLPQHIWAQDKWCAYTPTHIQVVNPKDWEQVNSCVILCVSCESLQHLRQSLGFTPLMYGKHKFHITIGIRAQDIDKETLERVEKMNKGLREQRINKIAKRLTAGDNVANVQGQYRGFTGEIDWRGTNGKVKGAFFVIMPRGIIWKMGRG